MGNIVQVALWDETKPGQEAVIKSAGVGIAANLRSSLPVVAIYVTYEDTPGNEVTLRYKAADSLGIEVTSDGETCIYERILSGSSKGAKVHTHTAIGAPTQRDIVAGIEDVVASADMSWDTFNGGTGNAYSTALAVCDAAVGYP